MNALVPSSMSSTFRIPRVPEPPHDPTSLLLNGRVGWRAGSLADLVVGPDDGALTLPIRAADRRALTEASGSFGGLRPPANVAVGPDGSVYLLDVAKLALKRFDPCTCAFEAVPCIGGEGGEGRQWRNAAWHRDLRRRPLRLRHRLGGCHGRRSMRRRRRAAHASCEPRTTASACLR